MLSAKYKLFAIKTDAIKSLGDLDRGQRFFRIIPQTSSNPERVDLNVLFVHSTWQIDPNFIMAGMAIQESHGGQIKIRADEKVVVLSSY